MRLTVELSEGSRLSTVEKLALVREVVAAYLRSRRSMRRSGLRGALADLRAVEPASPPAADPVASGRRLGRIVSRTLSVLPADSRCLSQSLVLTRLLAARGVESQLVVAVRPGESFAAHAWVEHEGAPLLPRGPEEFAELATL